MQAVTIDKFQIHDPINFVDPSGHYGQELQAFFNASWGRNEPQKIVNTAKQVGKTIGYVAAGGAAVGAIATVGPPLLAAAKVKAVEVALYSSIQYSATLGGVAQLANPKQVENIVGAGYSFISGFAAGITDTNTPKYDGNYSPGDLTLNFYSSEAGNYLGSQIRSNYVQE